MTVHGMQQNSQLQSGPQGTSMQGRVPPAGFLMTGLVPTTRWDWWELHILTDSAGSELMSLQPSQLMIHLSKIESLKFLLIEMKLLRSKQ